MGGKRAVTLLVVAIVLALGAGYGLIGSSLTGTDQAAAAVLRPLASSPVVYDWGQFGGGLPGPGTPTPSRIGPMRRVPEVVHGIHGVVTQVATSNSDGYALTSTGSVYAWGAGAQGELGNGSRLAVSNRAVEVRLPAGVKITALANPMPYNSAMGITADGHVWAWGNDLDREFCQRQGAILPVPREMSLTHVSLAAGAQRHALFDADGRVVSCGVGGLGELGNATSGPGASSGTPVAVRGLPRGGVAALTSSWGNAGALMADGRYYDWGYNADGQVGDGNTNVATRAVQVSLPAPVSEVFQGGSLPGNGQTLAKLDNGSVWEWGAGTLGQLGDHRRSDALRPAPLHALRRLTVAAVNSGGSTNYLIDGRGELWAWGDNRVGQVGAGAKRAVIGHPVRDHLRVSQVSSTAHNVAALGELAPAGGRGPSSRA